MNAYLRARRHPVRSLHASRSCSRLAGCMREPETALRIGTNVWIGSEPLYLARELGRLDPAAVQLVEYPSASEVLRAFRNQAIDGMVISLDELFGLAADGLQPRIILVVDVSHGADVVVGRRGMRTMHDLKGKSVAVESSALGAFVLSRALALNGMQASDVNVVHLESNEQPSAFEKGQVDGAVTFDPYRAQFLRAGATTLFDSTQIPGEIVDLLAVRATVLEKHPKAIQALLAGWFGAIDYMKSDPRTRRGAWAFASRRPASSSWRRSKGLHIPSREENLRMLGGATPELAVTGRRLMALMVDAKLLRAGLDIEGVLAPGPLRHSAAEVRPARPGVAQVHGSAHPAGLRRDAQHGEPALSRAAGRARGGGRQPQAAGARRCRACKARSSICCSRAIRRPRNTRSPCWRTTTMSSSPR